jgi:hypothetical protein
MSDQRVEKWRFDDPVSCARRSGVSEESADWANEGQRYRKDCRAVLMAEQNPTQNTPVDEPQCGKRNGEDEHGHGRSSCSSVNG